MFNEDGTTGYESYYTDMEGFWRDLYNPRPPIAGGADFIRLINEVFEMFYILIEWNHIIAMV